MDTKDRVVDFLTKTQPGQQYAFEQPGNALEANKMIGRMRTMLSRMRSRVRDRGRQIKPIRMELVNIEEIHLPGVSHKCRITIKYADGFHSDDIDPLVQKKLDAILSA